MTDPAAADPEPPLPPSDSRAWDVGLAAAFGTDEAEPSPSVLERLTGRAGPVQLRETGEGPLVRPGDGRARQGRYRILGQIARGGVGVILKGRDTDLGRDLAMKVLRDDHAGNQELVQRFVEEAQIGGQLQHPGIVPVYELGVDAQERPYFTMKLIQGDTLARLLEDRSDPAEDRVRFLRIFEQICDAMAYAHARGVVHRDLKPANILVGSFGEVQIVDWGFAKVLARGGVADEESSHVDRRDAALVETVRSGPSGIESQVGSVMGTPSYMPPEQALGRVDALDERTDVFALGAILCEIATGKPPYVGDSIAQVALKAQRADLGEALRRLDACGADAPIVELARDCLEVEPGRRPRDARRLAESVAAHLESLDRRAHDAQVEAARAVERAHAERRTRRLQAIFGGCAVVAVAAAAALFLWMRSVQEERTRDVETRIHEALRESVRLRGTGAGEQAAVALERARTLAGAPRVDPDLVGQVEELTEAVRRADDDARLVAALEAVRTTEDDETSLATDAYERVFAAHGIDVLGSTPEQVAARTGRGTELARAVAFALDDWVFRLGSRRGLGEEDESLLRVAQHLDDDAWRHELREAALQRDAGRMVALAVELDPRVLSPRSLDALGLALRGAREPEAAIELLRRSVRAHPGDFYLHFHLALLLTRFGDGSDGRAAEHARTALALRPDSIGTRLFLVRHLSLEGEHAEARHYLDEVLELEPHGVRARLMRAQLMAVGDDLPGALAAVEEILLTTPEPVPPLHLFRAAILVRMDDLPRAEEALRSYFESEGSERRLRGPRGVPGPGGPQGPGGPGARGARAGRQPADRDGDGVVGATDVPERLRPLFGALDRNASGVLEGDELRALLHLMREVLPENPENSATRSRPERDQE